MGNSALTRWVACVGLFCIVQSAFANPPELTQEAIQAAPSVTLGRTVFVAANDVQQITGERLKGFAEASNLWSAIIKDGVVDAPELHFLQLVLRGPGEILLVAHPAPSWHPDDVLFRNYWIASKGRTGLPAPLDYLRRKVAIAELDLEAASLSGEGIRQTVARP